MKFTILILCIFSLNNSYSQEKIEATDTLYVKINKLPEHKILYMLNPSGGLCTVGVDIKNKQHDYQIFGSSYTSTFFLKKKNVIKKKDIVSYHDYNKFLNEDYVKAMVRYKLFFIISADKSNYLLMEVRPLFLDLQM